MLQLAAARDLSMGLWDNLAGAQPAPDRHHCSTAIIVIATK